MRPLAVKLAIVGALAIGTVAAIGLALASWKPDSRWHGRLHAWWSGIQVQAGVRIPMPDGASLSADILLPRAQGPHPTILIRTPYGKEGHRFRHGDAMRLAEAGFAVVVQDLRGRHDSDGEFAPYAHALDDGRATLDWIVAQPWSNGRVGGWGTSALGETQLILARSRHPALAALAPQNAGGGVGVLEGDYGYFGVFEGGVPTLASAAGWFAGYGTKRPPTPQADAPSTPAILAHLPSIDVVRQMSAQPTDFEFFLDTPLSDPAWAALDYVRDADRFNTPALHVSSWFDQTVSRTLAVAARMRQQSDTPLAARNQFVIIGPGTHSTMGLPFAVDSVGDLPTPGGQRPLDDTYLRWYRHWLQGPQAQDFDGPRYQFYDLGAGRWTHADQWPPAGVVRQRWHLDSRGHAATRDGDGRLTPDAPPAAAHDTFVYDPLDPVPTRGGAFCCTGNPALREGPVDQADVEARPDVLVYTSEPLPQELRIAGPIHCELVVATSASDTDFTARLVDVFPDGRALNVRDSVLRLRYRDGIDRPRAAVPGERYRIRIPLGDIAWTLPAGHRLRLQVSSSNFPRLERNLNTFGPNQRGTQPYRATNTVWHGGIHASHLDLPVWPASPGLPGERSLRP